MTRVNSENVVFELTKVGASRGRGMLPSDTGQGCISVPFTDLQEHRVSCDWQRKNVQPPGQKGAALDFQWVRSCLIAALGDGC